MQVLKQAKRVSVEGIALGRLGRAVPTCCQRNADKLNQLEGGGEACRQAGVPKIHRLKLLLSFLRYENNWHDYVNTYELEAETVRFSQYYWLFTGKR